MAHSALTSGSAATGRRIRRRGVGKTHIAQALGHAACRRGHRVCFAKTSRLLSELAGGHADGTWEARLRRLVRVDLLILDDFGLREFTVQQGDDFFELVSERHKHGSMILTSNCAPGDWYGLFPNPVVAEGVLDRLVNCAHHWRRRRSAAASAIVMGASHDAESTLGWCDHQFEFGLDLILDGLERLRDTGSD
jgi:hypothetical protein